MVNDVMAGEYQSAFKGRGMEFEEVREYQPGDEIRTIDWNVTARMGRPFIKRYVEERELTVMLLVDASGSCRFGSTKQMKSEIAAELCAVLAFSAVKNNDKVGLIIFTDKIEKFIPPRKGQQHVLRVVREVLYYQPTGKQTNIGVALDYMNKVITHRCVTFLVSDFQSEGYETALRITNKRHDVIATFIIDPRELDLPKVGFMELEDAETGERILVDTRDVVLLKEFNQINTGQLKDKTDKFRSLGVDAIQILTHQPYVDPLIRFFRMREKRL